MPELKTCPFCGGTAELNEIVISEETNLNSVAVRCSGCGITSPYYPKTEEATEAWNKRSAGWISVNDRLPEEETPELLFSAGGKVYYGSFGCSKFYAIDNSGIYGFATCEVTRWMYLPEPPEVNEE